jgi:hypothetical protein
MSATAAREMTLISFAPGLQPNLFSRRLKDACKTGKRKEESTDLELGQSTYVFQLAAIEGRPSLSGVLGLFAESKCADWINSARKGYIVELNSAGKPQSKLEAFVA